MKPIHVDFAPRSAGRVIGLMRPVHWLLAVIGLGLCAGGMVALNDLTQRQAARQTEREQFLAQAAVRTAPRAEKIKSTISEAQASVVNSAIEQLNLPWSRLLAAVERATPSSVALLELAPDAKRHLVRGVAEAKTSDMMLDYIKRLKQQPFLGNVILTKHVVVDEDTNRPLRFEFEAEWLEGAQ